MMICKSKILFLLLCSPLIVKAKDDFDRFFEFSDDPHPTDVLIDEFASTIQKAHELSAQLEDKVPANKEVDTLAVELNDVTKEMSSVVSGAMIKAMKEASRILRSARSCQDLANLGITQSGRYEIDPDGPEGEDEIGKFIVVSASIHFKTFTFRGAL